MRSNAVSSTLRLEPLCHSTTLTIKRLNATLWVKPLNSVCPSLSFWLSARVRTCSCAKILVSYRRPHKRGSDLEEGASPPDDKLLGRNKSTYFQLHLVPEEPVHGAGQLFPGSCKFDSTRCYFQLHGCTLSALTAPLCLWLCVQKFFSPKEQGDGSLRGINHNRFMVTDRAIYLGKLICRTLWQWPTSLYSPHADLYVSGIVVLLFPFGKWA